MKAPILHSPMMGLMLGDNMMADSTPVVIEDYFFDSLVVNELTPIATGGVSDFHDTWDLDGTDYTPEASPDDEGYWDDLPNVVLNGDYEELGSELVTNGTFDADSNWTKGTGWTISGGSASCDGTQTSDSTLVTSSSISGIQNKPVKFSFELSNCTSGTISATVQGTGGQEFSGVSQNKTYTTHITSVDSTALITFTASSDFVGDIDNISVKQVDPNDRWGLSNTAIEDGALTFTDNSSAAQYAFQDNVVAEGNVYEITLTVNRTSGTLKMLFGTGGSSVSGISDITSSGTYTFITTPLTSGQSGNGRFWPGYTSASDNFIGTVDNVTVREYAITPLDV